MEVVLKWDLATGKNVLSAWRQRLSFSDGNTFAPQTEIDAVLDEYPELNDMALEVQLKMIQANYTYTVQLPFTF